MKYKQKIVLLIISITIRSSTVILKETQNVIKIKNHNLAISIRPAKEFLFCRASAGLFRHQIDSKPIKLIFKKYQKELGEYCCPSFASRVCPGDSTLSSYFCCCIAVLHFFSIKVSRRVCAVLFTAPLHLTVKLG